MPANRVREERGLLIFFERTNHLGDDENRSVMRYAFEDKNLKTNLICSAANRTFDLGQASSKTPLPFF